MVDSARRSVRPYLRAPERRRHLLDAAARLVREQGWAAVSVQAVAEAAGVTRQLVYGHFESLEALQGALLAHLFESAYEATRATLRSTGSTASILRKAYEVFLAMPGEQRFVLRSLTGADPDAPHGASQARRLLRTRIAGLWVPLVARETGLRTAEAQALTWMLLGAAWALADLVADGSIARRTGVDLFVRHAVRTLSGARVRRTPRRRAAPPRAASPARPPRSPARSTRKEDPS